MIKLISLNYQQQGFSLLETLVAFAILALVFTVILQIYGGGLRSARLAHEYTEATVIAQAKLAAAQPGDAEAVSGIEQDKYHWLVEQQAAEYTDEVLARNRSAFISYDIKAVVDWYSVGKQRKVELETVRLANK